MPDLEPYINIMSPVTNDAEPHPRCQHLDDDDKQCEKPAYSMRPQRCYWHYNQYLFENVEVKVREKRR